MMSHLLRHDVHSALDKAARERRRFLQPRLALGRRRAGTRPGGYNRARLSGILQSKLQGGVSAHAEPHDVSALDREPLHDGGNVVHGKLPAILIEVFGNVAGRIAARIVGDAAVGAREMANLGFPLAAIRSEFVDENDRVSATGFLTIQLYP